MEQLINKFNNITLNDLQNNSAVIIQSNYRRYLINKKFRHIVTKFVFKNLNIEKYTKLLYVTYYISDDNMYKFIKSVIRERILSKLLPKTKYVGNIPKWNTDIIYPNMICDRHIDINDKHFKFEIKCLKKCFLNNKDTCSFILYNAEGNNTLFKDLLNKLPQNIYIIINTSAPFSISYCLFENLYIYINKKNTAMKYKDILNNIELLNTKITQINAYIKSTDIIHLYNNLIIDDYKISNFDQIESMLNDIYNNL